MKRILIAASVFVGIAVSSAAFAKDEMMHHDHQHQMHMADTRISLGLPEEMKQHQLSNMREHMEAIKSIVGLISENKLEDASKIAHARLGLTADMQAMCNMFDNKDFKALGLAFHKSGDDLGAALKTRNVNASLRALNKTMQYCVECHATYRQ
ncbi:MAG: cytochrome C [Gallionellales bacterium RIFCSPLOWO2_12_FULL_59_22]|nr:MAG: cytochrome C [Gallionellales bacterium RIFCSPLOWO2_02_FULL_59_110]OGT03747.1 MAG: cytochrome C [Gallionellales bacterium RIFCSPLOWO2_02_58_13]OGT14247.1 MAG: cytochrome C [Gallionellales bacterium RIFCSPLOWO2_12_FULL_59_22]